MIAAALRKLCEQLEGMRRRARHTPGTGQHHTYLLADDVDAYIEEARKALATTTAPPPYDPDKLKTLVQWYLAGELPPDLYWNVAVTAEVLERALGTRPTTQREADERARFEATFKLDQFQKRPHVTIEGDYQDSATQCAWTGWQLGRADLRAALAQSEAPAPEMPAYLALQSMANPYNERDHGPGWQVAAHAWDMAIISAMRIVGAQQAAPEAPASEQTAAPAEVWLSEHELKQMRRILTVMGAGATDTLDSAAAMPCFWALIGSIASKLESEGKPAATTASASGESLFNAWRATQPDPHKIPAWGNLAASTQIHWNKEAIYGRAPARQTERMQPSREADEPNMIWQADDPEVFANGPDDFANDYADNCLRTGEESEVEVDCAYRGHKRTMRITVVDKGDDDTEIVWKWAGHTALARAPLPDHRDLAGLNEFIAGYCNSDSRLIACAEAAWYRCMARNGQAAGLALEHDHSEGGHHD